jgi:transcriptional regulator with XRE-family HTH domain
MGAIVELKLFREQRLGSGLGLSRSHHAESPMPRTSARRKPELRHTRGRDRYVPSHEPLAAKWKELKAERHLSQKAMAAQAQTTEGAISQFLNGRTKLTVEMQLQFAKYMRVAVVDIWHDFPFADLCPGRLPPDAVEIAQRWIAIPDDEEKTALAALIRRKPHRD